MNSGVIKVKSSRAPCTTLSCLSFCPPTHNLGPSRDAELRRTMYQTRHANTTTRYAANATNRALERSRPALAAKIIGKTNAISNSAPFPWVGDEPSVTHAASNSKKSATGMDATNAARKCVRVICGVASEFSGCQRLSAEMTRQATSRATVSLAGLHAGRKLNIVVGPGK